MANYIDHKLSARASRQFRRIATGSTNIVELVSGAERRNARWKFKKMRFLANFALLTPEAQEEISSAFYAADAMLLLFRFRDSGDFRVVDSPFGVYAGTRDPVQLTKAYTFGPRTVFRELQAVTKARVFDGNGNPVAGELDNVLGLFTPDDPWHDSVHKWSGTFDLWVRFNSDDFDMTMVTLDIATVDVELIEQRAIKNA